MKPFITGEDIETREYLFGRDKEIDTLLELARRHEMAGIVAPRRFGKTCVLKTIRTILREINNDAYPVYFSAYNVGIRNNTDETYCRMAAAVATQMCKDGILSEGDFDIYKNDSVSISSDEIDTYEAFLSLSSERRRQSVCRLAEYLRAQTHPQKYLLLLIDEIDYTLKEAFESPNDFMRLREAATKRQAILKFWVAGPASWKSICTYFGSHTLNCGLQGISLPPLSFEDFSKMWQYECSLIKDESTRSITESKLDFAFRKSGGVPFYGRFIGRQYQLGGGANTEPTFMILQDNLKEVWDSPFLLEEERKAMLSLSKDSSHSNVVPKGIETLLIEKGLVRKTDSDVELSIGYLVDYIRTIILPADSVPNEREDTENKQSKKESIMKQKSTDEVFIVHGHDSAMKESVKSLLKSFGLKPVILAEKPNKGKTIIEKFEANTQTIDYAVVLMSDEEDQGHARNERRCKPRARQNVILELGYFIGKLGRDRVCVLKKSKVETPSDILGIVYTEYIQDSKDWQIRLADELRSAGYQIDKNSI